MSRFICANCQSLSHNWMGKCSDCGEWGTFCEHSPVTETKTCALSNNIEKIKIDYFKQNLESAMYRPTKLEELDRVLGGGLVKGAAILIGGEPGIGKSTLIMQIAAQFANQTLYISGEESLEQISLRAARMGLIDKKICITTNSNLENILDAITKNDQFQIIIVDSIQTIYSSAISGSAGSINQIRHCTQELINKLKNKGVTIILVGHVTKGGQIAGPKMLEHMVDTVLYFEDDEKNQYRIIRAVKNRFGNVDEIGIFEMHSKGLETISNPSSIFLNDIDHSLSGTAITAGLNGSRPIMVETHALIANSYASNPKRSVLGWDLNRLSMMIAVLSTHCKLNITNKEVYLNIARGLKIHEPAVDLAAAAALISAYYKIPLPIPKCVIFGEITLSGEVKSVSKMDLRLKESQKLGFTNFITPKFKTATNIVKNNQIYQLHNINDLLKLIKK